MNFENNSTMPLFAGKAGILFIEGFFCVSEQAFLYVQEQP